MPEEQEVMQGSEVQLHFSLALKNNVEVISTFADEPATITIGEGAMIPTLEMHILGMRSGEEHTFTLTPEQAYGPRDEHLLSRMPVDDFPRGIELESGNIVSFNAPDGESIPGTIIEVENDMALVDFNHPLAGNDVIFKVKILDIDNAKSISI